MGGWGGVKGEGRIRVVFGFSIGWGEGWCPRIVTGEKGERVVIEVVVGWEENVVVGELGVSGRTSVDGVLGEIACGCAL